jgi:hypothetical protein
MSNDMTAVTERKSKNKPSTMEGLHLTLKINKMKQVKYPVLWSSIPEKHGEQKPTVVITPYSLTLDIFIYF